MFGRLSVTQGSFGIPDAGGGDLKIRKSATSMEQSGTMDRKKSILSRSDSVVEGADQKTPKSMVDVRRIIRKKSIIALSRDTTEEINDSSGTPPNWKEKISMTFLKIHSLFKDPQTPSANKGKESPFKHSENKSHRKRPSEPKKNKKIESLLSRIKSDTNLQKSEKSSDQDS